jgi:TetR/AcrR family transcriptional regulator, repressor for neighboring sulfatase
MARTRRSAPEARRAILEAAEKRLREGGPEAVRLQDVARDLGVSHPAILHHFGSREGLMGELAGHVATTLEAELLEALRAAQSEETVLDVLERVFETLGDARHARLLAWRALAGDAAPDTDAGRRGLRAITALVHERRSELARANGRPAPPREDSEFMVRLAVAALLGDGIAGEMLDRGFGHAGDGGAGRRRFRGWLARLLVAHEGVNPPRAAAPGSSPAAGGRPPGRDPGARR